jgi:hypothetical protein
MWLTGSGSGAAARRASIGSAGRELDWGGQALLVLVHLR